MGSGACDGCGLPVKLHYVHAPIDELRHRLEQRNANLHPPKALSDKRESVRAALRWFQPPSPEELA